MSAVYALTFVTPACRSGQDLPAGAQAGQPRATADVRPPADAEPWQIALREYDGAIHFDGGPAPQRDTDAVRSDTAEGGSFDKSPDPRLDGRCGYVVHEHVNQFGDLWRCDVQPIPCDTSSDSFDRGIEPHLFIGPPGPPVSLPCCFKGASPAPVPGSPDGGCPINTKRRP